MTIRKKIILIVIGMAIIAGLLIFNRYKPLGFRAFDDQVIYTSNFYITIIEDNQPVQGRVIISGDCPDNPVRSNNGTFTCQLKSLRQHQRILGLALQSFATGKIYSIPLEAGESDGHFYDGLILNQGELVSMNVTIRESKVTNVAKVEHGKRTVIK